MAASFGYNLLPGEEGPLNPDNLLISPKIELPNTETPLSLKFLLGTNVEYLNDHNFSLYIVNDFTGFDESWEPVYQKNFMGIDSAQNILVDISAYQGQTIQLVFRHHHAEGQFVLLLDDIEIIEESLSVEDLDTSAKIVVYPNPAREYIHIRTHEKIEEIALYNANGQWLFSSKDKKIDVRKLPQGVYFLKIKTANKSYTKKFIKK